MRKFGETLTNLAKARKLLRSASEKLRRRQSKTDWIKEILPQISDKIPSN